MTDYSEASQRHLERENTKIETAREETLAAQGIKDEYFVPKAELTKQIQDWIKTEQSQIDACKRNMMKEKILCTEPSEYYPKAIKEYEDNIAKFEAKIKELGV